MLVSHVETRKGYFNFAWKFARKLRAVHAVRQTQNYGVRAFAQIVKLAHSPQRDERNIGIDIGKVGRQKADNLQPRRHQHFVLLYFVEHCRGDYLHNVADADTRRIRHALAYYDCVVVEVFDFSVGDKPLFDYGNGALARNGVVAAQDGKSRNVVYEHHHRPARGQFDRLDALCFFKLLHNRREIFHCAAVLANDYVAGGVAQFRAYLLVEAVHNALRAEKAQHAERNPENRYRREERDNPSRRKELLQRDVQPPLHILFGAQRREQNGVADIRRSRKKNYKAVDADAHSARRRHSVFERRKKVFVQILFFLADLSLEHFALYEGVVLLGVCGRDFLSVDAKLENVENPRGRLCSAWQADKALWECALRMSAE